MSYKQNIEHCYAHSLLVNSCHSQCDIFMSVPLFVLLGFFCLFVGHVLFVFAIDHLSLEVNMCLELEICSSSHDTLILVSIYFSLYARSVKSCFLTFYYHHIKTECIARVMKEKM